MTVVLVITGNRETAADMSAALERLQDGIKVRTVCCITEYDDELDDVDVLVTDGTTQPARKKPGYTTYKWFSWPEYSATKCRYNPIPVIQLPHMRGVTLPDYEIEHYAREALSALPRRW